MATIETPGTKPKTGVREMSWDPITRIVGSLGIHTEIDFDNQKVNKCYSTSMIFRGFDIFMKGIDPRDTHFLTSRICGICGDNHCTTSVLCQNMAYGIYPPKLGNCAYNLAELADYMFDHAIYNDCMCNVDFCEQMVKDTNPSLLAKAEKTPSPHGDIHGFKTIADIMRALNPFTGEFYLETLQVARYTREMYCLFGGRHTHPSTIMPGGVSADITHQTCTDYYVRLMRYVDYAKRTVPLHDDIYDFFLQELPGYDMVGYRETDLVCWGAFDDPDVLRYDYKDMTEWGNDAPRHARPRHRRRADHDRPGPDQPRDPDPARLVATSTTGPTRRRSSRSDPLGNPVDKRHPWNKVTLPKPQARDFSDKYSWVVSPRMYDERNDRYVACDTGGGPFARQWVTAKAGLVDIPGLKATGHSPADDAAQDRLHAGDGARVEDPGEVQRDRARPRARLPPGVLGDRRRSTTSSRRWARCARGGPRARTWSRCPTTRSASASTRRRAACSAHHMVIRDGKVANYQPYPPTPWNANPRDSYGTPGPYEDAVQNTPIFEENGPDDFKGVDIMRAVHSFDPCLPCGVHMYTGKGKVRKVMHTPTGLC